MLGFKRRRRKRLRKRPFPPEWLDIIHRNVPYYAQLSPEEQHELQGHTQILIHEKYYEGCGGLEITDEIRVTIAAQAAILLLHRDTDYYPSLRTILVYPSSYVVPASSRQPDGTVIEGEQMRHGESWQHGAIVLAWDNIVKSAADINDGRNLVFHEFAHQLDNESGASEGAPALGPRSRYISWARVLSKEFERLRGAITRGTPTILDRYGATNPAEFYAVATECFFERPIELKLYHPELYEELSEFYKQDPATRYTETTTH